MVGNHQTFPSIHLKHGGLWGTRQPFVLKDKKGVVRLMGTSKGSCPKVVGFSDQFLLGGVNLGLSPLPVTVANEGL